MAMAVESKVPFIKANVMKCQCPRCPVQGNSRCAQQLIAELQNVLERETVLPREVPGLYCSSGLAGCLDYRNPCMCGTCPILNEEYDLAPGGPAGFFCKGGRAVSYREFGRLGETGG